MDVMMKMSDGNPGAITVLMKILEQTPAIDPDCGEGLFTILQLDTLALYGPHIWMLYKDVCGEDITRTLAVIRGWQQGVLSREQITNAVLGVQPIDPDDVLTKVKERLPRFGRTESPTTPESVTT